MRHLNIIIRQEVTFTFPLYFYFFQITAHAQFISPEPIPVIEYTVIPIDRSQCGSPGEFMCIVKAFSRPACV